jgi:hypothetical protein
VNERSECVRSRRGCDTGRQSDQHNKYNARSILPFVCLRCRDSSDRLIAANDQTTIKTLETTKTAVKDNKTCQMTTGGATAFFFFVLMVMLDFTCGRLPRRRLVKAHFLPTTLLHAATRATGTQSYTSVLIEPGLPAISDHFVC